MEYVVRMQEDVYDKVHSLMYNIDELNKGYEIGAWLLGNWDVGENIAILTLTEFFIPKQTVSRSEVDISPESMIETIKELGPEKANMIKAHWHIHPFGTGSTSWSSTDNNKISDFIDPEKGREVFCFLLSSKDQIFARIVSKSVRENSFFKTKTVVIEDIDNLPVYRGAEDMEEDVYFAELKKEISEKITEQTYGYSTKSATTWGYSSKGTQTKLPVKRKSKIKDGDLFYIETSGKNVILHIDQNLSYFMENDHKGSGDILNSADVAHVTGAEEKYIWSYKTKATAKKNAQKIEDMCLLGEQDFAQVQQYLEQGIYDDFNVNY